MAVVRTTHCLCALFTTLSDVHSGFPRQSLVDVGVLKELIGVAASPALLSRCTNLQMCSAIMQWSYDPAGCSFSVVFPSFDFYQCGQGPSLAMLSSWSDDVFNTSNPDLSASSRGTDQQDLQSN